MPDDTTKLSAGESALGARMPIYLDYSATTPVDPRVADAMIPWLTQNFGNPASRSHKYGWDAERAVEQAREQVAALVNCDPRELVWTSGATESINLALKGAAAFYKDKGRHLITVKTEHKATLDTMRELERQGFEVTYLDVKPDGLLDLAALEATLRPDTIVVSVMYVNNEIGVIQDIAAIGEMTRKRGIIFHVDSAQATGKLPIDLSTLKVDLMSFSAHKTYGPKGVGALFVRQGTALLPQLSGGSQERQRRAGTENVAGIVGFARALELAQADVAAREAENARLAGLRDALVAGIGAITGTQLTGHPQQRLPNNASFVFGGIEGGDLVAALDLEGIEASTGSACTTGSADPSHVLLAMGLEPELAHGSLRLTAGRSTTAAEVQRTVEVVRRVVDRLRVARAGEASPAVASAS